MNDLIKLRGEKLHPVKMGRIEVNRYRESILMRKAVSVRVQM